MKVINLLPKDRQSELRYETVLHNVTVIFALTLVSFVLVYFVQFAAKFYLETKINSLQKQITDLTEQVKKKENPKVKAQVKAANDLVLDFKNLALASPVWTNLIKAFVPIPPEGIKINSFNVDPAKKLVSITGQSPTRALVIELHDKIAGSKIFSNIDFPLENISKQTNVTFHYTFNYKDDLIK